MNGAIPNCSKIAAVASFLCIMLLPADYRTSACVSADGSGHPAGTPHELGSAAHEDVATADWDSGLKDPATSAAAGRDRQVDFGLPSLGTERFSDTKDRISIAQNGKESASRSEGADRAAELAAETAFWNSVKDGDSAQPFRLYLQKYPEGTFAELAKYKLSSMKESADKDQNSVRVVIYRSDTMYKPSIFINDVEICRLQGKRFMEFLLPPGTISSGLSLGRENNDS